MLYSSAMVNCRFFDRLVNYHILDIDFWTELNDDDDNIFAVVDYEMNVWCSYKPVKLSALIEPLKLDFEALVRETFSDFDNNQFLENVEVIEFVNWCVVLI